MHKRSHIGIVRPVTALRRGPDDILAGVLDIAGFAMHAVLKVDLEAWLFAVFGHKFVNTRRRAIVRRVFTNLG